MRRRAFTLIELLVVIAIIVILAGILFPVFAQARKRAQSATCQSNLKQIGSAFQMYRQDYDETMPVNIFPDNSTVGGPVDCLAEITRTTWRGWIANSLLTYTRNSQLFACPGYVGTNRNIWDPAVCGSPVIDKWTDKVYKVGYAYNYVGTFNETNPTNVNRLPGFGGKENACLRPADMAIMWDSVNRWVDYNAAFWGNGVDGRDVVQIMNKNYQYGHWHNEQANFLFMDGHVKTWRIDQMKYQNFFNINDNDVRFGRVVTATPFPVD